MSPDRGTATDGSGSAKNQGMWRIVLVFIAILLCHLMFGTSCRLVPAMPQECLPAADLYVA
jgi:hypothetical protein